MTPAAPLELQTLSPVPAGETMAPHAAPAGDDHLPIDMQAAVPARFRRKTRAELEAEEGVRRFEFTGSGSEYFRIWVVNLLLTILTLGIYSAWAKVRRLRYFYRNTRLDGAIFDYHGNPKAILKGRILAVALLGAYQVAHGVSIVATIVVALALAALLPWLLARSFRFKMVNSSWRGVRFGFHGGVAQAYKTLSLIPAIIGVIGLFAWSLIVSFGQHSGASVVFGALLLLAVLALAVPFAHYLLKRFQHDNACYGHVPFFFHAKIRDFFKIYARAISMVSLGGVLARIFYGVTAPLIAKLSHTSFGWLFALLYGVLGTYVSYLLVKPFLESRLQNVVWNNTEIATHRFESTASARRLVFIHATNLLLITLTLGLFKPFATVRLMRYRLESLTLVLDGDLEEFVSEQTNEVGAMGQEAGDLFDIEIAL